MRLVLQIRLDVAAIIAETIGEFGPQNLLRSGRERFISLEPAEAVPCLILRQEKRTFLQHQDGFLTEDKFVRNRRSACAASDYHDIERLIHNVNSGYPK